MPAHALLVTQDAKVRAVFLTILAELSIETVTFTDISLAEIALKHGRVAALVIDCDVAGAGRLLNLDDFPSNREAISVAVSTHGKTNEYRKAGFAISKPLHTPLVRVTMRAASALILAGYRRSFRYEVAIPITLANLEKEFRAHTLNVSLGGLAIQTCELIAPDEQFTIAFKLPNAFEVKSGGRVVWVDKLGRAALRFTDMKDIVKRELQDWVDTKIKDDHVGDKNKAPPFPAPKATSAP